MKKKIIKFKTYFVCKFSILEGHFSMNMVKKSPKYMDLDFFSLCVTSCVTLSDIES